MKTLILTGILASILFAASCNRDTETRSKEIYLDYSKLIPYIMPGENGSEYHYSNPAVLADIVMKDKKIQMFDSYTNGIRYYLESMSCRLYSSDTLYKTISVGHIISSTGNTTQVAYIGYRTSVKYYYPYSFAENGNKPSVCGYITNNEYPPSRAHGCDQLATVTFAPGTTYTDVYKLWNIIPHYDTLYFARDIGLVCVVDTNGNRSYLTSYSLK